MRMISWNVNGLRAVMKKDFLPAMLAFEPDVICLQETKAQPDQVLEALAELQGYHIFANSAEKKGYSGTAILSRQQPLSVTMDMNMAEHDQEGRVIAAEYPHWFLVTVYTPNSGSELKRLGYRQSWDRDFLQYVKQLEKRKPVIVCGDLNVANTSLDLARPKENYNKSAGFMQEEIDGIDNLLAADLVDSFRYLHPKTARYSWWSYRAGARAKDVGWRIDYFLTSQVLAKQISKAEILTQVQGSDHCPVLLEMNDPV
jgi:exodeoxyribonuclease III